MYRGGDFWNNLSWFCAKISELRSAARAQKNTCSTGYLGFRPAFYPLP